MAHKHSPTPEMTVGYKTVIEKRRLNQNHVDALARIVAETRDAFPGESEFRYVGFLSDQSFGELAQNFTPGTAAAIHIENLPSFDTVQETKIMNLAIGEMVGACVAYSDYNHSYITDIRSTPLSGEASAGSGLLRIHSDLAFANNVCRPTHLVLTPHQTDGDPVRTTLAPADAIFDALDDETIELLKRPEYEVVSGGRLFWRSLRISHIALLYDTNEGRGVRMDLGRLTPRPDLPEDTRAAMTRALRVYEEIATRLGFEYGVAVQKGAGLIINNNRCLHGREEMDLSRSQRLLLRSYIISRDMARHHNNRMIPLSAQGIGFDNFGAVVLAA